ncbi:41472_t:CDS:1, partial [Gigaspora margarita]
LMKEDLKTVIDNAKRLPGSLARISDNLDEKEIANLIKSAGEFLDNPKKLK